MSGSDTDSTLHQGQLLGAPSNSTAQDPRGDSSKEAFTEYLPVERTPPTEMANADMEKGGAAQSTAPQESAPPALVPVELPDGGLQAWLVVLAGSLVLFCSFGIVNCSGVFIQYYANVPLANYSSSSITWITSVQTFLMNGSNLIVGRMFDSYGTRWLMPFGTIFYAFGFMVLSLSTKYYQIILSQGIVCGIGGSILFNCASNATLTWFSKHRAAALGLVFAGSSTGGIVLPILMSHLIPRIGFPWTVRILGFIVLALCGPSCLVVRPYLPPRPKPFVFIDLLKSFRETRYTLVVIGTFFVLWGFYLPFNYLPIQAQQQGVSPSLVPYILPIVNALSIPGRIVPGIVADKIGRFNVLILICILSAVITLALWVPTHSTAATLTFGAIYGFASGAFVSLLPAVVAQISDLREIGARNGMLLFIGSLGALTGPPIGGAILSAQKGNYLGLKLWAGFTILAGTLIMMASRMVQVRFRLVKI